MTRRLVSWVAGQPLPRNADRKTIAAIITALCFPVSPRTIERWPLPVRKVNGAALYETSVALAMAEAKLAAARVYKLASGRSQAPLKSGVSCGVSPAKVTKARRTLVANSSPTKSTIGGDLTRFSTDPGNARGAK
jgi:hypothetical protein